MFDDVRAVRVSLPLINNFTPIPLRGLRMALLCGMRQSDAQDQTGKPLFTLLIKMQ
jgi:hypothetical protein